MHTRKLTLYGETEVQTIDDAFLAIAKKRFHVDTLETRNRDSLDFYSVSVSSMRKALQDAYALGRLQLAEGE